MKKITLLVALLCSISVFSTRYLVQITGSSTGTWRAAGAGEVVKTYTDFSSFIWQLAENSSSNTTAGDEIWMLAGTYNVNAGYFSWKTSVNFYGGFAGNENATTDRSKVVGGKAWEFSNPTIWDGGNNTANFGLKTTDAAGTTYFDGLTLQNFKQNGTGNVSGVGAYLGISAIMQNCIVKNNSFVGTTANTGSGAGVYMKGAKLIDSYIYNNSCLIGTGTGAAKGGGVAFSTSVGSKIQGCTIEGNSATNSSGGIFLTQWNNGEVTVDNCILKNNSTLAATSGGGAIGGGLFNGSNAANKFNITNSQFINNTYTGGDGGAGLYVYAGGFAITITGCTFTGNTSNSVAGTDKGGGGIYIQASNNTAASPCIIDKCIFTGNTVTTNARGAAILTKSPTKITNCIIANNSCAVTNNSIVSLESSDCQALNCTFAKNLTSGTGGVIDYESRTNTTSAMTNCLLWGNSYNAVGTTNITFSYNAFDGTGWGTNTVTTLTATNTFVSPTSFQGIPVGQTQIDALAAADWRLLTGCPAIDAGTDLTSSGITTAIDGVARPQGTLFDMGAYERSASGTTAISELVGNSVRCYSTNQTIELQGVKVGEKVDVYGIAGNLLYSKMASISSVSIPSASGVFLVRVSGNISKVLVK